MKKVVFCTVAWMKYYDGDPDDKPRNGGKYVDDNGTGMERVNYLAINHYCYGYVMHHGNELHIERFDKTLRNYSEVGDITVVWVATDGISSKIVGWYEHATMYRDWQFIPDFEDEGNDNGRFYNFKAKEENCYLIPEEERSYEIPHAKGNTGKGMGQSQIWYADTKAAQEEVVPDVLKYIEANREKYRAFIPSEEFKSVAEDDGKTAGQLLDEATMLFNDPDSGLKAYGLINLAVKKEDTYTTRRYRGDCFYGIRFYDEAVGDYKKCLEFKEDPNALVLAAYASEHSFNYSAAKDFAIRAIKVHSEFSKEQWEAISITLVNLLVNCDELDEAVKLLVLLENEKDKYSFPFIEDAWKSVNEARGH